MMYFYDLSIQISHPDLQSALSETITKLYPSPLTTLPPQYCIYCAVDRQGGAQKFFLHFHLYSFQTEQQHVCVGEQTCEVVPGVEVWGDGRRVRYFSG
jgi:hypothetical protein